MAKLNSDISNSRQASTVLFEEEDEAFLRPAAPAAGKATRKPRRSAPELVPNYEPGEEGEQFLRARRRVAPKKSHFQRLLGTRPGRVLLAVSALLLLGALLFAGWTVISFFEHNAHFRIESSGSVEAAGNNELSRADLVRVFGSDIGRNIFFVPLHQRERALEAQPWVKHATVMRLLPNTLRVKVVERTPVAFVRLGRTIGLVDAEGVLLPMAPATLAARHYSFPVVVGLDPNSPPVARAQRMQLYGRFVSALDASEAKNTAQLSEVDLSDPEDVRAVVPAAGSDLLLHFGNSNFLERYRSYQEHLPEWRQQYPNLSAVDLRYDRQVVLKMADMKPVDTPDAAAAPQPHTLKPTATHHAAHEPVRTPAKKPARIWYTERRGPHHATRWVPHYLPNAGKGAR